MGEAAALRPIAPEVAEALLVGCLREFDHVRFQVRGTCMAPALDEGDTVLLAPALARRPRLGDVVLVRLPDGLRLHRLVLAPAWGKRLLWRTQADRGALWDPAVRVEAVIGTVVGVLPRGEGPLRPTFGRARALRSLARGAATWVGQRVS